MPEWNSPPLAEKEGGRGGVSRTQWSILRKARVFWPAVDFEKNSSSIYKKRGIDREGY